MKSKLFFITCAIVAVLAFGSCKKVVNVDALCKSFTNEVIDEQKSLGNDLIVDTIFLNQTTGYNYKGELRGHINDSTEVVYDLDVSDAGQDFDLEWNLRK